MIKHMGLGPNSAVADGQRITRGVGGHLLRIWYQILLDLGMPGMRFENLLQDFVNRSNETPGVSAPTRLLTRGNLRRELVGTNSITWRSFLRGLRVIRAEKVDFTCELTWGTGKSSMHSIVIDLENDDLLDAQKRKKPANVFVQPSDQDYRVKPKWLVVQSAMSMLESCLRFAPLPAKPDLTVNGIVDDLIAAMQTTAGSGGHLVRMFYQILADTNMRTDRFEYLLSSFARANKNVYGEGSATKQLTPGNLRRELIGGPAITWRAFVRGLLILRVKELGINVRLHMPSGKTSIHCITINLRQSHMEEEPDLTPEDLS